MIASIKGLKHAPTHFAIEILPQYLSKEGLVCYPMSVFEGFIVLKLSEPIPVKRIKIIFKASERVNWDVLGWEKSKDGDERLFAIRTTLYNHEITGDILEAGEHTFRFAIELPPVNFPPTIDHYLIATTFHLVASLERQQSNSHEMKTFRTPPYPVQFKPVLQTRLLKVTPTSPLSQHQTSVTQRVSAHLTLPSLEYNIFDTKKIPVQLVFLANHPQYIINASLQQVKIALKQTLTIHHKTFTRTETTTYYQTDLRIPFNSVQNRTASPSSSTDCSSTILLQADIPINNDNDVDSNNSNTDDTIRQQQPSKKLTLPTVTFSTRFNLRYTLEVSIKYRTGPLASKKKLFSLPIHFGTLPAGALPDDNLLLYMDDVVKNCTTLVYKPKFLAPINHPDEVLPAYDDLYRPPTYESRIIPTATTTASNHLRLNNIIAI
ncbi:unnamed protein product [Cunninghamella echinulata]